MSGEVWKINDLTHSPLRTKFLTQDFKPATNLAIAMGRVSIKKNKDKGNSDLCQLEIIDEHLIRENLVLAREPWDVAETAFKHERRRNFFEMDAYLRANREVKHVIFSHQSRTNRNRKSARMIEEWIIDLGVTLHCARDGLKLHSKSPLEDWMRWDLFNSLNAKFSEDHRKNVAGGVIKRIEMGLAPSKAPFGYKNHRLDRSDKLSVFVIEPEPSRYMRRAFELYATGVYGVHSLKKKLDGEFPCLKTPSWKRLIVLLKNPFYYGEFIWDGVQYKGHPEYHPRLITFALWKKVQDVFAQPEKSVRKVTERNHPYIGLIRCGGKILDDEGNETDEECRCSITGEEKRKKLKNGEIKRYYYYHCSGTVSRCSQRDLTFVREAGGKLHYPEADIERLFEEVFRPFTWDSDTVEWMKDFLLKQHVEASANHYQQLSALQVRQKMLEKYISTAYEDKIKGVITEQTWREKNEQWVLERDQVEKNIRAISDTKQDYIEKGILLIELAQRSDYVYKNANPEIKRKLVEAVSSNRVLRNGTLRFDYKKPFDLLAKTTSREIWWSHQESNLELSFRKAPLYPAKAKY